MFLFVKEQFDTKKLPGNKEVFSQWSLSLTLISVSLFFSLYLCSFKSLFNIYFPPHFPEMIHYKLKVYRTPYTSTPR